MDWVFDCILYWSPHPYHVAAAKGASWEPSPQGETGAFSYGFIGLWRGIWFNCAWLHYRQNWIKKHFNLECSHCCFNLCCYNCQPETPWILMANFLDVFLLGILRWSDQYSFKLNFGVWIQRKVRTFLCAQFLTGHRRLWFLVHLSTTWCKKLRAASELHYWMLLHRDNSCIYVLLVPIPKRLKSGKSWSSYPAHLISYKCCFNWDWRPFEIRHVLKINNGHSLRRSNFRKHP